MNKYVEGMEGCSDGGCIFQDNMSKPRMVTNGGCSCERELRRTPEGKKAFQLITILRREMTMHLCHGPRAVNWNY